MTATFILIVFSYEIPNHFGFYFPSSYIMPSIPDFYFYPLFLAHLLIPIPNIPITIETPILIIKANSITLCASVILIQHTTHVYF